MNENFALAGKGLKLLFLAQALMLAAVVVVFVPVAGWVAAPFMILAGAVLEFCGPYVARNAHPNFKNAFYMALVGLLLGIVSGLLPEEGFLAGLVDIITQLVSFSVTYFVCTAAETLLDAKGDGELAQRASLLWKLYGGCALVSIVCTLVSWIPVLNILAAVAGVVTTVVALVAYVLMVMFYYKAYTFLLS